MSIFDKVKHDIAQEYYTENYPNDGQRFVAWYLRNIHGLDPSEAKSCITDGADDKKIDAVYVNDDDETVYIIQGKFVQKKVDATPLMEIHSAWLQINDLQHLQENANPILSGKVGEISSALDDGYDIRLELVMTSELTQAAKKDAAVLIQEISGCEDVDASLEIVDIDAMERKYNDAIGNSGPGINCDFTLQPGRFMRVTVNGRNAVIAVISLRDCVGIPGISDGSLFRRNVRQSLGKTVKVNKEIAASLKNNIGDFFFLHNGITAICSSIEINGETMSVKDFSVVNGCQSLTTIYGNSEAVKNAADEGYIIFRFYETADSQLVDTISTSTNSQNAVKQRDLRSNDRYILAMKKSFEHRYPDGQFITKRGEKQEAKKNKNHVIELPLLGKFLLSWHLQKPTIAHEESKIFAERFSLLFHRSYMPEDIQALNDIYSAVYDKWDAKNDNPLDIDSSLFVLKSNAPFLHLFAVSILLSELNKAQEDMIPSPDAALKTITGSGMFASVIEIAGNCVNWAFMAAADEAHEAGRIFNPINWLKSSKAITAIRSEIRKYMKPHKKEDKDFIAEMRDKLKMSKRDFSPKWTAD